MFVNVKVFLLVVTYEYIWKEKGRLDQIFKHSSAVKVEDIYKC